MQSRIIILPSYIFVLFDFSKSSDESYYSERISSRRERICLKRTHAVIQQDPSAGRQRNFDVKPNLYKHFEALFMFVASNAGNSKLKQKLRLGFLDLPMTVRLTRELRVGDILKSTRHR